jgi:hypothetical protein
LPLPPATSNPLDFYQTATHGDSHSFPPTRRARAPTTVERLHEGLRDPAARDEAFGLDPPIEEIRLVPEDRRLRVELRGEPAEIPAPSADDKKADGISAASQRRRPQRPARNVGPED